MNRQQNLQEQESAFPAELLPFRGPILTAESVAGVGRIHGFLLRTHCLQVKRHDVDDKTNRPMRRARRL